MPGSGGTLLIPFQLSGFHGAIEPGVSGASPSTAALGCRPHVLGGLRGRPPKPQRWGDDPCHPGMGILSPPLPTLGCLAQHPRLPLPAAPVFTHRPLRLNSAEAAVKYL